MIFEDVNPELGNLQPFIKEVQVTIPSEKIVRYKQPEVHQDALLRVLKKFAECIAIQKFSILGGGFPGLYWKALPPAIGKELQSLVQLSSVSSLRLECIQDMPARLLVTNAHVKYLSVVFCPEIQGLSSIMASLPKLEYLKWHDTSEFPEGLCFSFLRSMNVLNVDSYISRCSWAVILRAAKTLKNLTIYDSDELGE